MFILIDHVLLSLTIFLFLKLSFKKERKKKSLMITYCLPFLFFASKNIL